MGARRARNECCSRVSCSSMHKKLFYPHKSITVPARANTTVPVSRAHIAQLLASTYINTPQVAQWALHQTLSRLILPQVVRSPLCYRHTPKSSSQPYTAQVSAGAAHNFQPSTSSMHTAAARSSKHPLRAQVSCPKAARVIISPRLWDNGVRMRCFWLVISFRRKRRGSGAWSRGLWRRRQGKAF